VVLIALMHTIMQPGYHDGHKRREPVWRAGPVLALHMRARGHGQIPADCVLPDEFVYA
jgi:hypothetical protein